MDTRDNRTRADHPRQLVELLGRIADLRQQAEAIAGRIGAGDGKLPGLLLARLHVDVDRIAARLAKHRQALEDASGSA